MKPYSLSVKIDLREFVTKDKVFKLAADVVRSGVKNEHGYRATKGLTDNRLSRWPVAIRFKTAKNRTDFCNNIKQLLHPTIIKKLGLQLTLPNIKKTEPVKYLRA
ncbi:hypothetical protein N0002_05495 [Pseudomonas aeruginosa]|nr:MULTISPECIES: hypothetical protein [Pseudomonas]ECA4546647.1 hypothetical protein [Salmonella enterica subsp. enterica serovar Typhimurium]HCL2591689.1 hypothetical protein [Pseudomonas aeruginosa C40A]EIU7190733.1 hypothetical protein [Pseudomonas aeruginosa]EKU0634932.1 hypothetical protein [Pseudomonas aeruginosa]EKV4735045.1 hypothetical protein [Pseudomonas aeruginosa]